MHEICISLGDFWHGCPSLQRCHAAGHQRITANANGHNEAQGWAHPEGPMSQQFELSRDNVTKRHHVNSLHDRFNDDVSGDVRKCGS